MYSVILLLLPWIPGGNDAINMGAEDWQTREQASNRLSGNHMVLLLASCSDDVEVRYRSRSALPTIDLSATRACWSLSSESMGDEEKDEVLSWGHSQGLLSQKEYEYAYSGWTRAGNLTGRTIDLLRTRLLYKTDIEP